MSFGCQTKYYGNCVYEREVEHVGDFQTYHFARELVLLLKAENPILASNWEYFEGDKKFNHSKLSE